MVSLEESLWWRHIPRSSDDDDACWIWTGKLDRRKNGYGVLYLPTRRKTVYAHRLAHELFIGPIPDRFHVDHLCHGWDESCFRREECPHRPCVNPAHLEAVTPRINRIRSRASKGRRLSLEERTHCPRGHELTPENRKNYGYCQQCYRIRASVGHQKRKGPIGDICGYISPKGNACQRQEGHDGRHHSEVPKPKYDITQLYDVG